MTTVYHPDAPGAPESLREAVAASVSTANSWDALDVLARVVRNTEMANDRPQIPAEEPKLARNVVSAESNSTPAAQAEHRVSCHRCGNIRKSRLLCSGSTCRYVFCARCVDKLKVEFGSDVFVGGCPVCRGLCCCSNRTADCSRQNHCYRKCPTTRHLGLSNMAGDYLVSQNVRLGNGSGGGINVDNRQSANLDEERDLKRSRINPPSQDLVCQPCDQFSGKSPDIPFVSDTVLDQAVPMLGADSSISSESAHSPLMAFTKGEGSSTIPEGGLLAVHSARSPPSASKIVSVPGSGVDVSSLHSLPTSQVPPSSIMSSLYMKLPSCSSTGVPDVALRVVASYFPLPTPTLESFPVLFPVFLSADTLTSSTAAAAFEQVNMDMFSSAVVARLLCDNNDQQGYVVDNEGDKCSQNIHGLQHASSVDLVAVLSKILTSERIS